MDLKKCVFATIAAAIVMVLLAGLWYEILMKDWYADHPGMSELILRAKPLLLYIGLGYLVLAALMAYIYPKGIEGTNKVINGLKFGALMGLLWIFPIHLVLYGVTEVFSLSVIGVDTLWHIVEQGIGGLIIALIYGTPKK